ncbi:hypothetical protein D9M70_581650 [compost metagenome]
MGLAAIDRPGHVPGGSRASLDHRLLVFSDTFQSRLVFMAGIQLELGLIERKAFQKNRLLPYEDLPL